MLTATPAWWECKLVDEIARGDHAVLMRYHNLNYGG
jgi:flavin reductase (DIM6/NTAB) family NADH-FMN oxidoreductase RutF